MEVLQKTGRKLRAEVRFEAQAVESIFFYSLLKRIEGEWNCDE